MYLIEDNSNSYMVVYSVKFHLALIRTDARHILSSELSDLHTFRDKQLNRQQNNSLGLLPFSDRMGKNIKENSVKTRFPECQNKKNKIKSKARSPGMCLKYCSSFPCLSTFPSFPSLATFEGHSPKLYLYNMYGAGKYGWRIEPHQCFAPQEWTETSELSGHCEFPWVLGTL